MVVERDRPPFRNGAKCTSYTVWPKEYLGPLTPQALLTNINIRKHIAQASVDKRFSCCSRGTRKKNKPKKHSRFTLQNARFEPYSYTVNSHVEKSCVSPLAVSHRGSLPAKKRKKKHKKSCEDPYHIKDIDQFDSLVAEFTAEEKDTVANACEVSCERSQEVSHGETDKKDQDAVGNNESSPSEEEERNREDRFTVYVRQLDNKVVGVTLHPGDTLAELRTVVKCPAATVKFYHRGKQLQEKLLLNEQGIAEGSNIDVHVGLLGGADNDPEAGKHDNDPEAGKHDNDPEAGKHELSENMEEWSEEDVVRWLAEYAKLKDEYIQKVKEEEIDGYNVKNTFTVKYLKSTIQMKSGPALKLIAKRDAFVNKTVEQEDKITSMSVEEVCAWLKDSVKLKKQYISKFREEEFDGWNLKHSLNEDYLKKTMVGMKSGPMDRLLQKAKQFIHDSSQPVVRPKETTDTCTVSSEPQASAMKCAPRKFGQYDDYHSYPYGWVLDAIETGPTDLINPAREFKFSTQQGKELVKFFLSETLPFFCACLNVRTNGTIYFGITDCKEKGSRFGEVVGLPLNDEEKANLEESLTACMTGKKYFQKDDQRKAAQKCYRLAFVKVSGVDESRYVIEVDIVPKAMVCGSLAFCVCLNLPHDKENKYYRRVGSSSCSISPKDLGDFLEQVKEYSSLREEQEKKEVEVKHKSSHLAERLKSLFCHDSPKKMSSFYHILVANKPPADLIEKGCLDFIKCIDWVAVLDFDPDSYTTGLAKLYKEKGMSEYFSEKFSNEYNSLDMKDLCHKIKFRTQPLWLSCNGRKDMEHIGSIKQETCSGEEFEFEVRSFENSEWNRNRRVGVKDAILFLSKEEIIPDQAKVVITFLLFSEDYEIVVDTFRNFADYFKLHRLMYIAEKDTMLHGWNTELEKAYAKDEHKKRGIVGMPWWQVNESIKRLTGVVEEGAGFLPSVTGHEVVLKERDRKEWNYLDVVCKNECENSERLKDEEEFKSFREEKEENFWKGSKKVEWWNFWFTENRRALNGQVLRRENHDKLKDMVVDHLKGNIEGEQRSVNVVQLFHHPGAGGSTMARQILWDLRKKYRCAVVKSPTVIHVSCEQILNLYLHGETQHCNPVLILIDEPDFGEAELRDFKSKIEQEINKRGVKVEKSTPVCVLLHCMSSTSAQYLKQQNPTARFALEQYLSEDEQRWCNEQLEKSMQNCPERNPHQFLSFMIFKNNFDRTYIEETVRGILSGIDMAKSEKIVLKYVSLLNKFVKGSAIPVVRCKALLGINPRNPQADQIHDLFSQSAQLLLVEVVKDEEIGTVPCYSTAHPLLAEEILNQLLEKDNQTLGELALEYLKSKIFMDYRFGREYVVRVTGQMLKGRAVIKDDTDNKDRKEDFSPLILQICDQEDNAENAVEIMKYAYDRFADGILAQQAARLLYIRVKNFEEARKYARKAVADKRSSYTLDTLGQVEKGKFKHRFQPYIEMQSELSPEHAKEAIKLAFDTMDCFQEAQKASKSEGARNLAGFCGEIQICFLLLELLDKCVPLFKGRERLRELLMSDDLPPDLNLIKDFWDEFKTLGVRIDKTLDYLADIDTRYKHDILNASKTPLGRSDTSSPTDETIKKFLQNNYQLYALYFCISPEDAINHVKDEAVKCKLRRSQVTALGGNNFFNIFQHAAQKHVVMLREIMALLKINVDAVPHRKARDIQNYILVNLALISVDSSAKTASLNTLCDLCEKLVDLCNGEEAYPYFLLYMFMWPLENTNLRYDHIKFKDALKKLIEIHKKHKRSPREEKKPYDRIQAQVYQPPRAPSTLFFLGKASGTLKQFIHVGQLPPFKDTPKLRGLQDSIRRDQFWKDPAIPDKLYRLKGSEYDGIIYVQNIKYLGTNPEEKNIEVRAAIPSRSGSSMRQVSFYLGFNWAGPVAYDVQTEGDSEGAVGYSGGEIPVDDLGKAMPEEEM